MSRFLYFAYGSNLSEDRIHKNNPSARRLALGKLKNYRLDFLTYASGWKGAIATIVPHPDHTVWGAVWEINLRDLPRLDRQEGVHHNVYMPLKVEIELTDGTTQVCRTYMQTATPTYVENIRDLPRNRQPSPRYLRTILEGAAETGITGKYLQFLKSIPHNGEE